MNTTTAVNEVVLRKNYAAGVLEMTCQELELPESKREKAKTAYGAVGDWLSKCQTLGRFRPRIFPQGSMALGTTVKPLNREEFDVDLVCHLSAGDDSLPQAGVKMAVGNRLSENDTYKAMQEEYKRCWRLNYAEESQLHLDITPAVNNRSCARGGLCVTDKDARHWQPSHPEGYVEWFDAKSKCQPRFREQLLEKSVVFAANANIEPLPENVPLKGYLRRTVQLIKRHRSLYFEKRPALAPISIILTTLAAKAYESCAASGTVYDTEFDLVCDVIARLPSFVEKRSNGNGGEFWVPNETTEGENFAEKWNKDVNLAKAFYEWQPAAHRYFVGLAEAGDGQDAVMAFNSVAGERVAKRIRERIVRNTSQARVQGVLRTGAGGILSLGVGAPVARNTFFGAE